MSKKFLKHTNILRIYAIYRRYKQNDKRNIPEWAKKHQTKNTQIYIINNKYCLYKIHSKWNKEKSRAQKITGEYLGRITTQGFTPKKPQNHQPQ